MEKPIPDPLRPITPQEAWKILDDPLVCNYRKDSAWISAVADFRAFLRGLSEGSELPITPVLGKSDKMGVICQMFDAIAAKQFPDQKNLLQREEVKDLRRQVRIRIGMRVYFGSHPAFPRIIEHIRANGGILRPSSFPDSEMKTCIESAKQYLGHFGTSPERKAIAEQYMLAFLSEQAGMSVTLEKKVLTARTEEFTQFSSRENPEIDPEIGWELGPLRPITRQELLGIISDDSFECPAEFDLSEWEDALIALEEALSQFDISISFDGESYDGFLPKKVCRPIDHFLAQPAQSELRQMRKLPIFLAIRKEISLYLKVRFYFGSHPEFHVFLDYIRRQRGILRLMKWARTSQNARVMANWMQNFISDDFLTPEFGLTILKRFLSAQAGREVEIEVIMRKNVVTKKDELTHSFTQKEGDTISAIHGGKGCFLRPRADDRIYCIGQVPPYLRRYVSSENQETIPANAENDEEGVFGEMAVRIDPGDPRYRDGSRLFQAVFRPQSVALLVDTSRIGRVVCVRRTTLIPLDFSCAQFFELQSLIALYARQQNISCEAAMALFSREPDARTFKFIHEALEEMHGSQSNRTNVN